MENKGIISKLLLYMKEEFLSYFGRRAPSDVFVVARGPIFFGVFFIWFFFGMFALWATTAKIESAAVARGTIVVESKRKAVQHLEGGIVKEILVKDGDIVKKGQPLILLDETASASSLEQIKQTLRSLLLERAKIEAESNNSYELVIIFEMKELADEDCNCEQLILDATEELKSHIKSLENDVKIFEKRIEQTQNEKDGFAVQAKSITKQITILKDELKTKDELFQKGYGTKSDVRKLEQKIAELEGDYGEYQAKIAKAEQNIDETKLEIEKLKTEHRNEHNDKLEEVNVKIANLKAKMLAAKDIVDRNVIRSPQDGTVTNIKQHTQGGVIASGDVIMEIVPKNDRLIIDAKIRPNDIDVVKVGLPTRVKLLAFKSKKAPILDGVVKYVSPDHLVDPVTNVPYFLAKIEISDSSVIKENKLSLYPGMQAEAFIVTGSRTFSEYLIQPIKDTMHRAFREE